MNNKTNTKEIGFEELIENQLAKQHGYQIRSNSQFNKDLAMDTEMVITFIKNSQPEVWDKLVEQHADNAEAEFLKRLDAEINDRGLLSVFRDGVSDRGVKVQLAFWKPQSRLNEEVWQDYEQNILSVMRQVKYSNKNENSIDTVIFLNGLPIFTVELKNQLTGQNVRDAIRQYQTDRDQKEKLLSFKRCLTHFAVDTEQVFMTTRLSGLSTRFLPFNIGYKNGSGNPPLEGKYKTSYLWEQIWSKDSVLDLVGNFIHLQVEEKEDTNGKKVKSEVLLFPRYHQLDTVRRIIEDTQLKGTGGNYLIQHSAGSGKSNTIAWTAHRLSELHNEKNEKVFDTVIVITDRRVLDRQLSATVESFSQVRGVVKHVESSAELKEALQNGVKVITSTLQKFPVIVDAIDTVQGTKFAVLIDEAHSSQTGEAAADLRQVLTLEDAEKQAEKQEKVFKTTEDIIIERMKARKVKTPNVSFLAFTATPKQKTLELFGASEAISGKFYPFSLYSMRQAIDEGFILDVLKNYTTYQTYFELLKTVEDDPEFDKKKAQRLLIGYVERHEHAIERKTQIMVEHFEEKISPLIYGKAKAIIVTKSRLHAVKYKLAFDKYLKEKGYHHKALVAFSGTVRDGEIDYTESQMNNGVPEKNTAEEFKKDDYKFLIVAEKFQTGFDQPLLSVMYVDKKLGGVSAVQTLSRLNRTTAGKSDVFVLDFVNETDDIKEAFQPYYTTTILSEATDPNILHDLERDVFQFKLFSVSEVEGFVEEYLHGANPDRLNAILDEIVERSGSLLEEERNEFKTKARDYIRKYAFVAQIVTFEDPNLEKLHIFLKFLVRKLPSDVEPLPYEVLETIDMNSYKIQKIAETSVKLENEDGTLDPMISGGSSMGKPEAETDQISRIIKEINDRFGTVFSDSDRTILNRLSDKLMQDKSLTGALLNNTRDTAKIKFKKSVEDEFVDMLNTHFDLYKKLDTSPDLKDFVIDRLFDFVLKKTNK